MSDTKNQNPPEPQKAPTNSCGHADHIAQFISDLRKHASSPGSPVATVKLTKADSVAILAALEAGVRLNVSESFMDDTRPIFSIYEIGVDEGLAYRIGSVIYGREISKIIPYKEEATLPYFAIYVQDGEKESVAVRIPAYNFGIGYAFPMEITSTG